MSDPNRETRSNDLTTSSGIPLKSVYTPEDLASWNYSTDLGMPGEFPYTRGVYPEMYRKFPWAIRQTMGYGSGGETAQRWRDLLATGGQIGYGGEPVNSIVFDGPTIWGYDSDSPKAAYQIGKIGVPVDHYEDFLPLLEGFPLDKGFTNLVIFNPSVPLLAMYIAAAKKRGYAVSDLRGSGNNDYFRTHIALRVRLLDLKGQLRLCMDILDYAIKNMPKWSAISVAGFSYEPAGMNSWQSTAMALASGFSYIEGALERGIHVNDVARQITFFLGCGVDFLEGIAKFRAARRIWARTLKERYGVSDERGLKFRVYGYSLTTDYTAQQPLINIVRGTIQALACVLGGVQALNVTPYDEALGIPTQEAHIMSVRTQQIIAEETAIPRVVDIMGGSYCMEWLTSEVEKKINGFLDEINDLGDGTTFLKGMHAGMESGYFDKLIERMNWNRQERIDSDEKVVVGINKYVTDKEVTPEAFKINPELARAKIEEVKSYKQNRDKQKVEQSLNNLKKATESNENTMPAAIEAAEAGVTIEEMHQVFQEVYGTFK